MSACADICVYVCLLGWFSCFVIVVTGIIVCFTEVLSLSSEIPQSKEVSVVLDAVFTTLEANDACNKVQAIYAQGCGNGFQDKQLVLLTRVSPCFYCHHGLFNNSTTNLA